MSAEQKILAISGRKQAGKDTCYKFLHSLLTRDEAFPGMSDRVRQFYFAEPLKRMCVDILGCQQDKVYGTDVDKNTLVEHLLWENFPVPVFDMPNGKVYVQSEGVPSAYNKWLGDRVPPSKSLDFARPETYEDDERGPKRKRGPMSVREVLQYWGTEIFRRQYHNVWADACVRAIRKSPVQLAVVTDCRFPNEVDAAKGAGGNVIRLTRTVFPGDTHASEVALDEDHYNWGNFDAIIYNDDIGIDEQCYLLYEYLRGWGWLPDMPLSDLQVHFEAARI